MVPCLNCETPEYCGVEIRRCLRKPFETNEQEGELTDADEIDEPELKKRRLGKEPEALTNKERDFLKEIINF